MARKLSGEYVLRVNDTGIGIKREDINKVMAPFGQVESGLTRSYEGTGLGLTLTQAMLKQHGGRLEIASKPGRVRPAPWSPPSSPPNT